MFEYILREIFLSVIAFLAGAGVSAGVFAFVLVIGVVPRILRCSRIENIILIENVMICGVVAGNISSVLDTAYNLGFANMPKVPVSNICGNIIIAIYVSAYLSAVLQLHSQKYCTHSLLYISA